MAKLTQKEIDEIYNLIDRKFSYDLGECDISGNEAYIEFYGKAYGNGIDGYVSFDIKDGKCVLSECDGYDISDIGKELYQRVFRFYPKVEGFSLMVQTD